MNKLIVSISIAALLLAAFPGTAMAQDYPGKWEIALFTGTVPTASISYGLTYPLSEKEKMPEYPIGSLARIYEPRISPFKSVDTSLYPYLGLRVGYRVARWMKVGSDFGWDYYRESWQYEGEEQHVSIHTITVIPKVTFFFATSRYVSAYAGFGFGTAIHKSPQESELIDFRPVEFAWQVTPIGITVGRKVPGFTELTIGKDVIGIKIGVGYRF